MRSSVNAAAFYKAMTALMDVPAKSPVKVLQEIKVEFTSDHCTLSATDFGTWLSVTIPASGDDFAFVILEQCRYPEGVPLFYGPTGTGAVRPKEITDHNHALRRQGRQVPGL